MSSQESATVYVLCAGYDSLYKVGRTSVPLSRRVLQLNTGAARPLQVVGSFPISKEYACKCESFVHASLKDLTARNAGGKEFFVCAGGDALICERVRLAWAEFRDLLQAVQTVLPVDSKAAAAVVPGKVAELCERRRSLLAEEKRIAIQKVVIEEALCDAFAEGIVHEGVSLLEWKKQTVNRFDLEAFRLSHPSLAAEFTRPRSSRTPVFQ